MTEFKPNTVLPVPIPKDKMIEAWFKFLLPCHGLTSREQDIAIDYLKIYFRLCKSIPTDENLRNKVLKSGDIKEEICKNQNLKLNQLEVYRNKLKKAKFFLENGQINPKLIPSKEAVEGDMYSLLIVFKYIDTPTSNE